VITAALAVRSASSRFAMALLLLAVCAVGARAQRGRITGTISDSSAGYPVGSVRVVVVGTQLGAPSSDDGRYTILGVPAGTYSLETRRLGYAPVVRAGVVVTAGQTTVVDFRVEATVLHLQATVVTGVVDPTAGTKVPFTVGRVAKEDAPVAATNAIAEIQGKISGVMIVPAAQPGDEISIQLRTPSSINKGSTPLLVVDGVILSESTADLSSLDIESIEVVKGAAGASLYGSRAANGVIQIRTSRGNGLASGQTQFTFRSEVGSSAIAHQLHWAQYHYYLTNSSGQYVNAAGAVVTRTQRVARPAATRFQDVTYLDTLYDPVKLFFDPGKLITNSLTIAQNGERTNFLTTLEKQQQDGVMLGHGGSTRNDVRINLDHRPRSDLALSISSYYSRSDREELDGNTFFDLINQAPDMNLLARDPDGTKYVFQPDPAGIRANPLYIAETDQHTTQRIRMLGSMALRYTPLSWLTADANVSYDRSDQNGYEFVNRGLKIESAPNISPGSLTLTNAYTSSLNSSASANLLKQFGALTARSTARILIEQQKQENSTASGTNFAVAGVPRLDAALVKNSASSESEINAEGYFLTGGLDYDGRMILDALVRRDGSSLFGAGEKWHTYYRGSAAYRMAEERWWPWHRINEFKLRVSQGTAGTRPSFADQYETYTLGSGGTLTKGALGNNLLKPETSKETEFGLDVIVDNKYSLQLSYAQRTSTDQLLQIPLPGALGYTTQWQNAGTVVGNSLELTLEAQLYRKGTTSWKMGFTADRSQNHISEFNTSCFITGITYRCAGEDLTTMYGTAFLHSKDKLPASQAGAKDQFEVNDDGLLVAVGPGGHYTDPGKWGTNVVSNGVTYAWGMPIILRDSTGQNAIVRIGNGNPKLHYGITNNVQWKGIQFYGLLDSQVGGNAYNTTKQRMYQFQRSADVDQASKPTALKKPIDYYVNVYNGATTTDWFVESGSFVKLREVSARYQLPRSLLAHLPGTRAVGASISLVGRNLYTWTAYSGYDPEVGTINQRVDSYAYPQYRTISAVFQLQF
jgi:TonB-linked SusC/RagA family outer membrane protein